MTTLAAPRSEGNFVTYLTALGDDVQVEIEPTADDFIPLRGGDRSFGALEPLFAPVFQAVGTLIRDARRVHPDAINIRFGIKLTGRGTAAVAQNAGDGHFDITLTWNRSDGRD